MSEPLALRALADRAGIASQYAPAQGGAPLAISDETRAAVLRALGFDVSNETACARSLEQLEGERRERWLPPTAVSREGEPVLSIPLPGAERSPAGLRVELREESGASHEVPVLGPGAGGGARLELSLPDLAPGYHALTLERSRGAREHAALLRAPRRSWSPADALGDRAAAGLWANLYALRSETRGLGIGDFGALGVLLRASAAAGADFVGLSPLHALPNAGHDISPYSPQSRWYRNPLYLDLDAIPELETSHEARAQLAAASAELEALRRATWLDYERIDRLQRSVLAPLHRAFAERERSSETVRGRAYRAYRESEGERLTAFARFRALLDWLAERDYPRDWREWPAPYRDPQSLAVEAFGLAHEDAVDLHAWVQFELDRQLDALAGQAREGGMRLGLYSDLAVGSASSGFDTWYARDLFVPEMSVGAPPDDLGPQGQDWGFPPMSPIALAARGFADWAQLVRANLRHAGALRIDHILGCMRLWWVPRGASARDGAYVRYPLDALLSVLAIESQRARALIIGEDLGTVPEGLEAQLESYGVLSLRVLMFEREGDGAFRRPDQYPARALVCADTHDVPTLASLWSGHDLQQRHELGLLGDAERERAEQERARLRGALIARLRDEGLLGGEEDPEISELTRAVHAFLLRTPAPLIALSLGDLAGEIEPVNLPGVSSEHYPSWSRRMSQPVEVIDAPAWQRALADLLGTRVRAGLPGGLERVEAS